MSDGLKDILSNLNKDIEQEKLLQYLNEHMPDEEKHAFESQMNDDEFMNDAVEGLQTVGNKENIPMLVQQLNKDLKNQLAKKNKKKEKRKIPGQPWAYYTLILLLLLTAIAWIVIKNYCLKLKSRSICMNRLK